MNKTTIIMMMKDIKNMTKSVKIMIYMEMKLTMTVILTMKETVYKS